MDAPHDVVLLSRALNADEPVGAPRSGCAHQQDVRRQMEEMERRPVQLRESEVWFQTVVDSIDRMVRSALPDGTDDLFDGR